MTKSQIWNKSLTAVLVLTLISTVLLYINNSPIKNVEAYPQGTIITIDAPDTVGSEDAPLPTQPFAVNISVSDVTDLYAWQIRVYFLTPILNFTSATYPPGHVFEGKAFVDLSEQTKQINKSATLQGNLTAVDITNPVNTLWKWQEAKQVNMTKWLDADNSGDLTVSDIIWLYGTAPLPWTLSPPYYRVKEMEWKGTTIKLTLDISYVIFGASLIENIPGVNVTGTKILGQLKFIGIGQGKTFLNLSRTGDETQLLNSAVSEIPFETVDDSVIVLATTIPPGAQPSSITIEASPDSVKVGSNITISGTITPEKYNVDVTISYRQTGGTWSILKTVKTDSQSRYTYVWSTNVTGTYELQASWAGDSENLGAESDIVAVTITPGEPFTLEAYLPYIIGVIAIVVVIVLVYFTKIRKK